MEKNLIGDEGGDMVYADVEYDVLSLFTPESNSSRAHGIGKHFLPLNAPERALLAFEKAIWFDKSNISARLDYSQLLANFGEINAALQQIHEVIQLAPTVETCVEVTRTVLGWAPNIFAASRGINTPPEERAHDVSVPVVSMSLLGNNGRFGNQLYQYAFLRIYAEYHGFNYEVPPWIGQVLFGLDDPPLTTVLPLRMCTEGGLVPIQKATGWNCAEPPRNVDLQGYFQYHSALYRPFKYKWHEFFSPISVIANPLLDWVRECRNGCSTLVVAHIRMGDQMGTLHQGNPELCSRWIRDKWSTWIDPRVIVLSDSYELVAEYFRDVPVFIPPHFAMPFPEADFYSDYFLLTQADVLVASRSSFSRTATMLNKIGHSFFRFSDEQDEIIPFDPWNSPW